MSESATERVVEKHESGFLPRLATTVADFLFPRLCPGCSERVTHPGHKVCPDCCRSMAPLTLPLCLTCGMPDAPGGEAVTCARCPEGKIHLDAARATTVFAGIAKTLVERLKYNGRIEYVDIMVSAMARVVATEFSGISFDSLVPVPLHPARRRERGFNQSEELADSLAKLTSIPVDHSLLTRIKPTPSQTRLSRRERAGNIRDAFACSAPDRVEGRSFLLVDDVYTTGATLNECARMLREGRASAVHSIAFARAVL